VGVFTALVGTATDFATRAFMSWFGPKGVSTMTFSLLVLTSRITAGIRIFNLAALTVLCSVIAHGLTDTPGANWIARHAERMQKRQTDDPAGIAIEGELAQ
jgi:sodium/hydrogen antiporter